MKTYRHLAVEAGRLPVRDFEDGVYRGGFFYSSDSVKFQTPKGLFACVAVTAVFPALEGVNTFEGKSGLCGGASGI